MKGNKSEFMTVIISGEIEEGNYNCIIKGFFFYCSYSCGGFPGGTVVKHLPASAGNTRETWV